MLLSGELDSQGNPDNADSRQIYVHQSMKIEDPCSTLIKRDSWEEQIKVLLVPDKGDQTLIIFRLPKDTNCMVGDILTQLNTRLQEKVDSIYLVTDSINDVRYVAKVRSKPSSEEKENNQSIVDKSSEKTSNATKTIVKDRPSVTSFSCLRENANITKVQTSTDTKRLTLYLRRNAEIILKYPLTPHIPKITITIEDFKCLNKGQYLNDIIVDFYLKYLMLEMLSPKDRERTYVYNTYFYTRLTRPIRKLENYESLAAMRHAEVKRWTKNINIFEKDFIIVPVHKNAHWFLVVICYPGLIGMDIKQTSSTFPEESYYPCILVFDSMPGLITIKKSVVIQELKSYLKFEYAAKVDTDTAFSEDDMVVFHPDVPEQFNSSDCGIYVLHYMEKFCKDFIATNTLPFLTDTLKNWFESDIIKGKREELKKLIIRLAIDSKTKS